MKKIFIATLLFSATAIAAELNGTGPGGHQPRIELMKCGAYNMGSLWVSFAAVTFSGENERTIYPSEITLFQPGFDGLQIVSPLVTSKESLAELNKTVSARVHEGFVAVEFKTTKINSVTGESVTTHQTITAVRDPQSGEHYYMGNWKKADEGQPETNTLVGCSVF